MKEEKGRRANESDGEMRGVIPNNLYSYNLFFFLFVFYVLFCPPTFATNPHILLSSETLTRNRTLVSVGSDFELGFFTISGDRWYIGIWYKKIVEKTYVWVANRDNPLSNPDGTLKFNGSNIVLVNQSNIPVWSTNLTGVFRSPLVAELLPTGNFVLRDSMTNGEDGLLWQSFDYPTDTLLPHMKLGLDLKTGQSRFLTSWKNSLDQSRGYFSFKLELLGLPEFILWGKEGSLTYRSGPWDGKRFNGMPEMQLWHERDVVYNFTENNEEIVFSFKVDTPNTYARFIITYQGLFQLFTAKPTTSTEWDLVWMAITDECSSYRLCWDYSYCDLNAPPLCTCFKGFKTRTMSIVGRESIVCDRKKQLKCNGDGFLQIKNMKLPDTSYAVAHRSIGLTECEERCRNDCKCVAYANMDASAGCVMWPEKLEDIRSFVNAGQDLYIRVAAAELEQADSNTRRVRTTIGLSVGATVLVFLSFIIIFWRRKHMQARASAEYRYRRQNLLGTSGGHWFGEDTEDIELPLMEYDEIATATNDFSDDNKLGEGGFGTVYKGMLPDGEEIAVKRLSKVSTQGTDEFKTELMLIAKLQHNNLVRLLGCFADVDEKILVYEYLENLSLDYYLFDKTKSFELNWQKRFDIIKGIARGLLYLHQDSRCKVIHRDLKASNILLDQDMIPKISDFGMARIFARDEDEATTRRIVGTYGYMSPEYAINGQYSEKSDVFSFGVLILEIISSKRNRGFTSLHRDSDLLSYVWRNMEEGTAYEVVDPNIIDLSSQSPTYLLDEVLKCINIGLMCVQINVQDRPTMSWVVSKLGQETEAVRKPRPPAITVQRINCDAESSSSSSSSVIEGIANHVKGR